MTLQNDTVLRRRSDIRFRRVGHEWVVVVQRSAEVVILNEWAGEVLDLVDGNRTLDAIATVLAGRFEGEPSEILTDVIRFAGELEAGGLCEATSSGAGR